jgi:hypothetical protein
MATNFGFPLIGMQTPSIGMEPQRRSWQSRIFDRLMPPSSSSLIGLEDDDKKALLRQGLLQLAVGLQSSPNFGQALTQGLSGGLLALNQGSDDVQARRLREQQLQNYQNSALPTEYRSLDLMAKAAGHQPGTPGYKQFFDVKGGLAARAVTGARKNVEITGADGIKRPGVFDPSSATPWSVYDETTQTFRPLQAGEMPNQQAFSPPAVAPVSSFQGVGAPTDPAFVAQFTQDMGRPPTAQDMAQIFSGRPVVRPAMNATAPASLAIGRSPEQQAALTTAAEEEAKLGILPRKLALETGAAAAKVAAEEAAKTDAKVQATREQKVRDAGESIALLNEARIILPQSTSGRIATRARDIAGAFGQSTTGAQADARLNLIAARLVQKVPRFEGPQSNIDVQSYREAAGDLANPNTPRQTRMAALEELFRLNQKAIDQQENAEAPRETTPRRLKFNPATGKIE